MKKLFLKIIPLIEFQFSIKLSFFIQDTHENIEGNWKSKILFLLVFNFIEKTIFQNNIYQLNISIII